MPYNSLQKRKIYDAECRAKGYRCWQAMKARCHNPNLSNYRFYGGRGVIVCNRWIESFDNFIADMGPRPSVRHSISRYNDNGNYEPNNCEWSQNNFVQETAKHGTTSKYVLGCRCLECQEAHKLYHRQYRKHKRKT